MIKTAVIGASGFIGSFLLKKYRETFPDAIGTSYSQLKDHLTFFDLKNPNVDALKLGDTGHKAVIISSAKPNVEWCEKNPLESFEVNVTGTLKLIKELDRYSIKTLFFSSDYVFDGRTGNYSDHSPVCPNTEYGRQKAKVESEIPNLTNNYAILRLSKIYGTGFQDNTLLDSMAKPLKKNQSINAATDQFFSPTYVEDVVKMVLHIQSTGQTGLFNVCNSNKFSRYEIAVKLAEKLKVSSHLVGASLLHDVPSMEGRPLNTTLLPSTIFQSMQANFLTLDDAIEKVAKKWNQKTVIV